MRQLWNIGGRSLAFAAWLAAGAAVAEPSPVDPPPSPQTPAAAADASTAVGEIVVEGRATAAEQRFSAQVDSFVHSQARPGIGAFKQISQWGEPVCPATVGLTKDFDEFVSRRIKDVAQRVGAPGADKCRDADVLVVFTTKPDKLMADVRDHHAGLLGYHFNGQTKSLARFEPPIKSWYVTTTSAPIYFTRNSPEAAVLDRAYAKTPFCRDVSECHIPPPLKSRFAFALVVVDAGSTEGKPIGAVADEIAMTVLSRPGPRQGCSPLPSVMDVLDPACPASEAVEELTAYDEAFLKALYAPHSTEILGAERIDIERAVQAVGPAAQDGQ